MNKKILFIVIFLIASISFVSAADSIPVKVIWDDASQADAITVNLLCDGKVVDTATLNASNSWKTTFKNLNDDGNYEIKVASKTSDYSIQTTGNAESGYVITAKIIGETLGSSADDTSLEDVDETPIGDDDTIETTGENDSDDTNTTDDDNTTDEDTTDDNETDDETIDDNETDNNATDEDASPDSAATSTMAKSPIKENNKNVKQEKKNNKNPIKAKNKHITGIPIAGLVLVVFAAAFVPFSRKK